MIYQQQFYRKFITRRVNDLNRILPLDAITELPVGCVGHILDNLHLDRPMTIVPDLKGFFFHVDPQRKFLYNVTEPDLSPSAPVKINMQGIVLPQAGVKLLLNRFRQENIRTIKTVDDIAELPVRTGVQSLISYDSLWRLRIFGMLRRHRIMNFILMNLVNYLAKLPERDHYICIPAPEARIRTESYMDMLAMFTEMERIVAGCEDLDSGGKATGLYDEEIVSMEEYTRMDFMRAFKEQTKATIRYPEIPEYLLLMHFLSFVEASSKASIFELLPRAMWKKVNIIFLSKNNALIYNFQTLKDLNGANNQILIRLIKNLNNLSRSNYEDPTKFTTVSVNTEPDVPEEDTSDVEPENTPTVGESPEPLSPTPQPGTAPTLASSTDGKPIDLPMMQGINQKLLEFTGELDVAIPELLVVKPKEGKLNAPAFMQPITPAEHQEFSELELSKINLGAQRVIEEAPTTPAQKQRATSMADAFRTVELNGHTIEDLVLNTKDQTTINSSLDFLADQVPDASMLEASAIAFDKDYLANSFDRDMAAILVSFNQFGMFLTDVKTEPVNDELNSLTKYTVSYEDTQHKKHTIRFTMPTIDDRGFCYVNGNLMVMKKQRVANPICKVSDTRVTLNSNFNKFLVERNTAVAHSFIEYIVSLLTKYKEQVKFEYGVSDYSKLTLPYEYTAIARRYDAITVANNYFHFKLETRFERFKLQNALLEAAQRAEYKYGVLVKFEKGVAGFMDLDGSYTELNLAANTPVYTGTLIDKICQILGANPTPLTEWIDFKLLNKSIPVIFALAYRFGLSHMLQYMNVDFQLLEKNERAVNRNVTDIVIRFADKKLIIKRNPLIVSLVFSGLSAFDLSNVNFEEMDEREVYYDLIQTKRMSIHNIKGIDDYFDFFMDPITADVLSQMKEPTNTKDLLIRAAQLLSTEDHQEAASSTNFRFRSYERMNAELYNAMARAFTTYRNKSIGATNKFSINEYVVKQAIVSDQLMENVDVINPINDIKYACEYSHVGIGGRAADSFVVQDRRFPDDALGIMSEATVDSGKTGMNAQLSMNPTIANTRGMTVSKPPEQLDPANMLSVTSMLMAGVTQDDGKRRRNSCAFTQ